MEKFKNFLKWEGMVILTIIPILFFIALTLLYLKKQSTIESQKTYHIVCRDGDYIYEEDVKNLNYSHQNIICYTNSANARMCRSFATCTWTHVR